MTSRKNNKKYNKQGEQRTRGRATWIKIRDKKGGSKGGAGRNWSGRLEDY